MASRSVLDIKLTSLPGDLRCVVVHVSCSGCKFAHSWSSAVAAAASAAANDSHNGSSDEGLSHAALPCSCLAAVAEPNTVVALLSISQAVYMEVSISYIHSTLMCSTPAAAAARINLQGTCSHLHWQPTGKQQ
jgi:hypothetical protein